MRRGGRLILLLGVLIAAFIALAVVFLFNQSPGGVADNGQLLPPTEVPRRQVVVARIDIPRNTVLTDTETFLTFDEIPETDFNASPQSYFVSFAELQNKQTIRDVLATERLRAADVTETGLSVQIPAGQQGEPRPKAIPFLVNNLTGVADEITPGDYVDVLASFTVDRVYLRPGFDEAGNVQIREDTFTGQTTKTLLQNVQVLKIKRPAPPPEGTPTPGTGASEGPPATDESGQPVSPDGQTQTGDVSTDSIQPGTWLLILAVTDQQAEIIKFSRERSTGITLVLRGRGDTAVEDTLGATLDLLVSQFGLPLPEPAVPAVNTDTELTPVPTTVPADAGQPAAPTQTPTP